MHCVEHLAGMNCVLPQINQIRDQFDEFVCNRACRCLHSITLASLTVLRTPASTNWSGWRRSKAGDRAPELARHGQQVAVVWHRRGCPAPCPHLSLAPPLPFPASHRAPGHGIWSPRPPHTRARTRPAPPKLAQRAREASPPAELALRHPTPSRHTSLATATMDTDRRRGPTHHRVAAVLCRIETIPTVEHLAAHWTRTAPS